ncbi:MAG: flagellar hook-basal body complex protein [Planctomycetaceae bacterium]
MANSLLTGVSGLTTHQKMIEVVGHNLANLNTTGFKARTASFADVFYETVKGGTGGALGLLGGSNPAQIGHGSKLASVSVNQSQGGLDPTGGQFDFAIDGQGYFVLNSDKGALYSRAGAFGLDLNGTLIDVATGYPVQRFGTVGDVSSLDPAFQTPGSPNIRVPLGASVPGEATSVVNLRGNLSPTSVLAVAQILSTVDPWTNGGNPVVATDTLNSLDFVTTGYVAGDTLDIHGTNWDGSPMSTSISVSDTSTIQDLIDGINASLTGATASLNSDGRLVVESDAPGQTFLSVSITDAAGNTGTADFVNHEPVTSVSGLDGDIVRGGIEVYDEQGSVHTIGIDLRRAVDGSWELNATIDPADGVLLDGTVSGITFNANGTFNSAGTPGTGDANLVFQFSGSSQPQAVRLNFGDPNTLTGVTGIVLASSLAAEQDGYSTGTLVSTNVNEAGVLEGVASNGRRFPLAQLAIASFSNPDGLESQGDNMFRATSSSGNVELGPARSGGRGSILVGQLEQSNVDIAVEFTRLIIAQRGFSANARTITVTDQVLKELTDLLR